MGKKKKSKRYVASKVPVSTPFAVRLTQPSAWRSDGGINGPFEVVRFHFIIEDEPLAQFGWGKATTSMVSADGTAMTAREKMVVHHEEVNSSTLVEDHLQSTDLLAKLGADASIGSEHFGTAAFTAAVETHFAETFQNTRTVTSATTRSYTHEVEVEVSTPGGTERTVRAVPYQQRRMSIWLHHMDYLTVTYKPTLKGLRWKRVKSPAPGADHNSHRNWVDSGIKLGSYQYWESQGSALTNQISVSEHAESQINPLDVTFTPATSSKKKFYGLGPFRARPSLYKVSNAAFPLKDSQRREGWTEEQLLQLSDWATPDTSWVWERTRKSRRTWGLAGPET